MPQLEQRLVFGSVARAYDEHRPGYPDALLDELLGRFPGVPTTLDIGCGTGRVAVALAQRGVPGVAVEPDPDMAAVASEHLDGHPWRVVLADFETAALPVASFDLLTCGQAWHWIDPDAGLARARQLLRPGGWLATFWNRPEWPDKVLRADLDDVYARLVPEMPSSIAGSGRAPKGRPLSTDAPEGFRVARLDEYNHHRTFTTEQWLALLATHSDHVLLDPEVRDELHAAVAEVIEHHGGVMDLRYRTECWSGQRA